jgi:hypothetical protein
MISGWLFALIVVALEARIDRLGGPMEILKLVGMSAASVLGGFAINLLAASG